MFLFWNQAKHCENQDKHTKLSFILNTLNQIFFHLNGVLAPRLRRLDRVIRPQAEILQHTYFRSNLQAYLQTPQKACSKFRNLKLT